MSENRELSYEKIVGPGTEPPIFDPKKRAGKVLVSHLEADFLKPETLPPSSEFKSMEEADISKLPDWSLIRLIGTDHLSARYLLQKRGDTVYIYHGDQGEPIAVPLADINRSVKDDVQPWKVDKFLKVGNRMDMPYFSYEEDKKIKNLMHTEDPNSTWSDGIRAIQVLTPKEENPPQQ